MLPHRVGLGLRRPGMVLRVRRVERVSPPAELVGESAPGSVRRGTRDMLPFDMADTDRVGELACRRGLGGMQLQWRASDALLVPCNAN